MRKSGQRWIVPSIGVALLLIGLWGLGANEQSAAAWLHGLARFGGNVLLLGSQAAPAPGQNGKTALVTGVPEIVDPPGDRDFHVYADTPLLVRKVAMFQWREVRVGGSVSYQQDWVDHAVDSRHFDQPVGHANTQPFPFTSQRFAAPKVELDHYMLAAAIVRALPGPAQSVTPDFSQLPANLQASFQVRGGMLTTSANPGNPQLGDLRVSWLARPIETVTVVARIEGDQLVPSTGTHPGFQVQLGTRSLTDIFASLPLPPSSVWAWRAGALVLAWLGAWLVLLRWCRPRMALPVALAISVTLLGVMAGIMWVTTIWVVAVIAWVIAILAAVGGWQAWRRLG